MKKISRKQLITGIGKLQGLIGHTLSAFRDDRDPDRADKIVVALEEAFELCIDLRSTD